MTAFETTVFFFFYWTKIVETKRDDKNTMNAFERQKWFQNDYTKHFFSIKSYKKRWYIRLQQHLSIYLYLWEAKRHIPATLEV